MRRLLLIVTIPLLVGAGPCSDPSKTTPVSGTMAGEGVVHQGVGPECPQVWHIVTSAGDKYWPIDDPAFQKDGMRVRFSARLRSDAVSICMAGTMVEVISIEELR